MTPRPLAHVAASVVGASALAGLLLLPPEGLADEAAWEPTPGAHQADTQSAEYYESWITPSAAAPILDSLRWTPWVMLITWVLIGAGMAASGRAGDDWADQTGAQPRVQPQGATTRQPLRTDEPACVPSAASQMAVHGNSTDEEEEEERMAVQNMAQCGTYREGRAEPGNFATVPAAAPATAAAVIDRAALAERLDHNVGLLIELIDLFAQQSPRLLSNIRTAIASGSAEELELNAHSLKGALGNLGADQAAAVAFRLERLAHSGERLETVATYTLLAEEVARVLQALKDIAHEDAPFGTHTVAA